MFMGYSYEDVKVLELNPLYTDPRVLQYNPFLRDSLLIGQDGRRTISKLSPGWILNTIDNPIFPNFGKRLSASFEYAGVGGNTNFYKPRAEVIWYFRTTERQSLGLRFAGEYIVPFGDTVEIPIFERLFQGGEYSIRGFDLRSVGPQDESTGLVLGGNKSFLFNGEYIFTLAPPVRLILFFDTGQVQARGDRFSKTDFKTSTGAEVRFMMPVMNVPLRLIFAYNPQRSGVLDNSFRPESAFNFRFAVGSSF
jgi:outer membrane protein insertion porin family